MDFSDYKDDKAVLGELIGAYATNPNHDQLFDFGVDVGKIYTDHGLPIDMALDKIQYPRESKILILHGALWWLVEHRRNSSATDKALDRQRKNNREVMRSFLKTGETGVY